jgi:hypothetical protein
MLSSYFGSVEERCFRRFAIKLMHFQKFDCSGRSPPFAHSSWPLYPNTVDILSFHSFRS